MSTSVPSDPVSPLPAKMLLQDLRTAVETGRLDQFDTLARELASAVRTIAAQPSARSSQELSALQRELLQLVAESKARREEISRQLLEARKSHS